MSDDLKMNAAWTAGATVAVILPIAMPGTWTRVVGGIGALYLAWEAYKGVSYAFATSPNPNK